MSSHAWLEITVHIGQTIRVSVTFVFAYREKLRFFYIVDVACSIYLYLFGNETISSEEGSIGNSDIF